MLFRSQRELNDSNTLAPQFLSRRTTFNLGRLEPMHLRGNEAEVRWKDGKRKPGFFTVPDSGEFWDLKGTSDVITNPGYVVLEMRKCPNFQKGGKRPTAIKVNFTKEKMTKEKVSKKP